MRFALGQFARVVCGALLLPAVSARAEWVSLDSFKSTGQLAPARQSGPNSIEKKRVDADTTRLQMRIDALDVTRTVPEKTAQSFVSLRLTGNDTFTGEIGKPRVPVVSRFVEFTGSLKDLALRLEASQPQELDLTDLGRNRVVPVQPPLPKIRGAAENAAFVFDEKFYARDEYYPASHYAIRKVVRVRGRKLALVDFHPVRYNPLRNTVLVKRDAAFEIEARSLRSETERSSGFRNYFGKSVLNFDGSKSATPGTETMLIVAGTAFKGHAPLAEYAELKRRLGFNVVLRFMDELSSSTPAAVRRSIQDFYTGSQGRLAYVMVVGDVEHVPVHKGSAGGEQVTDHYYAAIDRGTYEEDLGGPDLFVSRVPVKTTAELDVVLRKLTKYQTAAFQDASWTRRLSWVATDDRYTVAEGTHNYVIDTHTRARGYTGNFPGPGEAGGDRLYAITHHASTPHLIDMFRQGRLIINYSGHGSHTGWEGPDFHKRDVDELDHPDALPFVVGNACITNTFSEQTDSFGEDWIKAPKGAIAYWGTTNNSYWDEDDVMERAFFDAMFRDGVSNLGALINSARGAVWQAYAGGGRAPYYMEIYNLNGDASLDLFTEEPAPLDLSFDPAVAIQRGSFPVQVLRRGQPGTNVYVSLLKEGRVLTGGFTNSDGSAEITLEEGMVNVGDRLTVSAMGRNSRASAGELEIISSGNDPYLTLRGHELVDDADSVAGAGDSLALRLVLANRGQAPSGRVRLSIQSRTPLVRVVEGVLELGAVAAQEQASPEGLLKLALARSIPDGTVARLDIHWEEIDGNASGDTRLLLPVAAPVLALESYSISERNGNGNGHIEAGEDGRFQVTLFNRGHAPFPARNAIATLYSYTDGVVAQEPMFLTHDIATGGSSAPLELTFAVGNLRPGSSGRFVLRIAADDAVSDFPLYAVFGVPVANEVSSSSTLPIAIPDNNHDGVKAVLGYPSDLPLEGIDLFVRIAHSYVGDLVVELVSPAGDQVVLHEKQGGSQDDLECWYVTAGTSRHPLCTPRESLAKLLGKSGQGTWTLKVRDLASSDTGRIEAFRMTFRGHR